jgi:hypothetical protein
MTIFIVKEQVVLITITAIEWKQKMKQQYNVEYEALYIEAYKEKEL